MITINNHYRVDYEKYLYECKGNYDLFYDLVCDDKLEIDRAYEAMKKKTTQTLGFFQAVNIFKDYLPTLVKIKLEYVKDKHLVWRKIKNLLESEGKLEVEKSKEIPIEYVCEQLGIKLYHGRAATPFVQEANNITAFMVKNNRFRCFRTGKYGTNIDLVMEVTGNNFIQSVKYLNALI